MAANVAPVIVRRIEHDLSAMDPVHDPLQTKYLQSQRDSVYKEQIVRTFDTQQVMASYALLAPHSFPEALESLQEVVHQDRYLDELGRFDPNFLNDMVRFLNPMLSFGCSPHI